MISKKGFTLIELLATIVVLAIIMIITLPKILDVIENAEKKSFSESANLMGETARLKYITSNVTNKITDEEYIFENNQLLSTSPILNFSGEKPKSGIIKQEKGKISYALTSKNGKWCAIKKKEEKVNKIYKINEDFLEEDCVIDYVEKIRYYIEFDANHGQMNEIKKRVTKGEKYGQLPLPTREEHIFKGWYTEKIGGEKIEESTIVTKNAKHILYARWEAAKHIVTFKNYDGTILQTGEYEVGEIPEYQGSIPIKPQTDEYEYEFSGWDNIVEAVLEDKEYTAQFTEKTRKYTITFKNEDGTILQSSSVNYGATPTYNGATPTKTQTAQYTYTFSGWSPTITTVTGAKIYTAAYTESARSYTVTFKNGASTHEAQTISYGSKATKPETNPSKEGYIFRYWSTSNGGSEYNFNTTITGNLRLHAVYQSDPTVCLNNNVTVGSGVICKRATTLHTEVCTQTNGTSYCSGAGYTASGSKRTNQIVYGNCGTRGALTSGDAFDCDVTGRGDYERFYYVTSNGNNAVLIYYNNTTAGVADNTSSNLIAYSSDYKNYQAPETAYTNLPSTSQWSNNKIITPGTRQITYENGNTSATISGTTYTIESFTYTNKAARLITYQEVKSACGSRTVTDVGYLDKCNYLLENTKYSNSSMGTIGYWLETPRSSMAYYLWFLSGYLRNVLSSSYSDSTLGVRPVIEVLKSNMSY